MGEVDPTDLKEAYKAHQAEQRIGNTKVGCILVVLLMPAGSTLDFFVYPERLADFFILRLICSAIGAAIWAWLVLGKAKNGVGPLGLVVPMLPVVFIAGMIAWQDGFQSPYYAGLNLVLLAIGAVLHWSVKESLIAVLMVMGIYVAAGVTNLWINPVQVPSGVLFNNFYFITLMDVIVVVGTFFQSRQAFREFGLRFELDHNKQMLEESHEKLVELDQVKSRFFANISHELRTPLTLMLAPMEAMMNVPGVPTETRQTLQSMHSNGMRLLKLINDLLDLVRLESGTLEIRKEPVSVSDFMKNLVSAAQQMAEDKGLQLGCKVSEGVGTVSMDRDKMEKVLLNLQFNALKFTREGEVELSADVENDWLVMRVRDTGIGMAKKHLPHVFDRFWQEDGSSKRKYQGVGIGLSLVKELSEAHGGKVAVDSDIGVGTVFTVRLPYEPISEEKIVIDDEAEVELAEKAPSGRGTVSSQEWLSNLYRQAEYIPGLMVGQTSDAPQDEEFRSSDLPSVLIADDEPEMLKFLKSQLDPHYKVYQAQDGQQAIEKANRFLPDIILLDMMMPEKDGMQACSELREQVATKSIPIIILTARADESVKMESLQAGANDFLAKPFSATELKVRIKNLIDSLDYQRRLSIQNTELETMIHQLKEAESQLVQNEKLASLGRMSAGIIHEINNPLNFATTGLYTLKKKGRHLAPEEQEDFAEVVTDVEEGIRRVKTIVSDLKSFSHHDDEQVDRIDVAEVVTSSLRFLSHDLKDDVKVETHMVEGQFIWGNQNKLIQVVVNLVQNAVDAMQEKEYSEGEEPSIWIKAESNEDVNRLRIRDNGPGIDAKVQDKIFDPFVTTKDVGKGTGLGLSICYKIVEQANGSVEVKSEPGRGCEFILSFPVERNEEEDEEAND